MSNRTARRAAAAVSTTPKAKTTKKAAAKKAAKPADADKAQKQVTLRFPHEKNTKGAVRWAESGEEKLVGTIYTRKDKLASLFGVNVEKLDGKTLKVTLEIV